GARQAADAALAADATAAPGGGGEPVATPTSQVDITVVGRHRGQPSLPTVSYAIGADSDCFVYVVIPSKEYKATVSTTRQEGDQHYRRQEGTAKQRETSGTSVDVKGGGSTTTKKDVDVRVKQTVERKQKYATRFVTNTHTAIKLATERSFRQLITELVQSNESEASTKTTTGRRALPDQTIDVEGEDQLKQEDPSIWERGFDFLKEKLGNLVKDKLWSYADKLLSKRVLIYRLIPKKVKDWAKRKVTDLVWRGGKWLWNKITGGDTEVKHTPEDAETVTDVKVEEQRRKESSRAHQEATEVATEVATSYATDVSRQVQVMFEKELNVKTDVDVGARTGTTTTKGGSVGVHGEKGRETETGSGEVREDSSQRAATHTYTTDVVRIETGKPVIELTIKPK
ncbi:MAG: hypothetical protein AB1416_06810, partial [Actinomycetota bacterium]